MAQSGRARRRWGPPSSRWAASSWCSARRSSGFGTRSRALRSTALAVAPGIASGAGRVTIACGAIALATVPVMLVGSPPWRRGMAVAALALGIGAAAIALRAWPRRTRRCMGASGRRSAETTGHAVTDAEFARLKGQLLATGFAISLGARHLRRVGGGPARRRGGTRRPGGWPARIARCPAHGSNGRPVRGAAASRRAERRLPNPRLRAPRYSSGSDDAPRDRFPRRLMGFLTDVVGRVRRELDEHPLPEGTLLLRSQALPPPLGPPGRAPPPRDGRRGRGQARLALRGRHRRDRPGEQAARTRRAARARSRCSPRGGTSGGRSPTSGAVRAHTALPVLRKDFIVHPAQILEARANGADAVLLIVGAVTDAELLGLLAAAGDLGHGRPGRTPRRGRGAAGRSERR